MPRPLIAALAAGLALIAAQAQAQAQAPVKPPPANLVPPKADANNDGKLTLAELEAVEHRGLVSQLDVDRDGQITRPEFKLLVDAATRQGGEAAGKQMAALFLLLDTDKNGAVSVAERDAATKRKFDLIDTNHDGWLSRAEVAASGQLRPRANP